MAALNENQENFFNRLEEERLLPTDDFLKTYVPVDSNLNYNGIKIFPCSEN